MGEHDDPHYAAAMDHHTDERGEGRDLSDHPGVGAVLRALQTHGVHPTVRHLPDAVRTAEAAAKALDITPAEIANSLVFTATRTDGTEEPLLVMASGGHRVNLDKVASILGLAGVRRADPAYVKDHTGFTIGGVAPVGHPRPIRTVVDVILSRYGTVWAAAGHSHSVFATTYDELIRVTAGHPMDVI